MKTTIIITIIVGGLFALAGCAPVETVSTRPAPARDLPFAQEYCAGAATLIFTGAIAARDRLPKADFVNLVTYAMVEHDLPVGARNAMTYAEMGHQAYREGATDVQRLSYAAAELCLEDQWAYTHA